MKEEHIEEADFKEEASGPLFDDDGDPTGTVDVPALFQTVHGDEHDTYGLKIPARVFPAQSECHSISVAIVDDLKTAGVDPLDIYIGLKQFADIAKAAMEIVKKEATEDARTKIKVTPHYKGIIVSMRKLGGYWKYDPDVETERQRIQNEIQIKKDELAEVERKAKEAKKATRIKGSGQGLTIKIPEIR